jgi:hypothetical protein
LAQKGTRKKEAPPDLPEIPGLDMKKAAIWRPRFLASLAEHGHVVFACKKAKVKRNTAYKHRRSDPEFAKQWKTALDEAIDMVEGSLISRAIVDDTTAAIFLLKAHRPELYREKFAAEIAGIGGAPIKLTTPIERDARLAELIARGLADGKSKSD